MLTLYDYDSSNGGARRIYVSEIDSTLILNHDGANDVKRLQDNNILRQGGDSVLDILYNVDYLDVALCAVDTPLFNDGDKESF